MGGGTALPARDVEMLRSALVRVLAVAAVAVVVLLSVVHDAGSVQAQQQTPAEICASSTVNIAATETALRSDCEVLLGIRDTLRGTATLNWGGSVAFASWTGIGTWGTTAGSLRVTYLWPRNSGLDGSIPSDIGRLTGLTHLWLEGNRLTGSIPSELSELSNLQQMRLWNNRLTGEIPDLNGLTSLTILYLSENQLTGGIPDLSGSTNLTQLYLSQNQLTGSIPASLGSLTSLTRLVLWGNRLTGEIPDLSRLTSLTQLQLSQNQLSGGVPSWLNSLTSLTRLDIDNNRLTGEIPDLSRLTSLTILYLSQNQLTGEIPDLSRLTSLTQLQLNQNQLSGGVPSWLNSLTSLTRLNLDNNRLTGEIPDLSRLTSLTNLYLSRNRLTGGVPSWLGNLTSLTRLYLWGNRLTGEIPDLSALTSLAHLSLSKNRLTGPIPSWLSSMTGLTLLNLNENELAGGIPSTLNSLTSLTELNLWDNQLTGEVPDLNGLTALTRLGLGGNNLDISWSTFEMGGNLVLDSSAPATRSLTRLYLHDSGLGGSIPEWIGARHTNLEHLWLQNNGLTGAIPSNFSNLTRLADLRLRGNMLTGGWEALIGLPELEELSLGLVASVFTGDSGRSVPIAGWPLFLKLTLPSGADPSRSGVTLHRVSLDLADVFVPRHPRGIGGIVRVLTDLAVDITTDLRDAQGEPLEGTLGVPVVCLPVPSADAGDDMRVLKSDDGEVWTFLGAVDPPSGYDPGAGNVGVCGTTDGFSQVLPVVVEIGTGSPGAGLAGLISRIEPSIRDVTVSQGDSIRLSFDIYGRQQILNNDLGEGHVFVWDDGSAGGSISPTDRANSIIYIAPESPGKHTVTVASPTGACFDSDSDDGDDRCNARFTITVRRPSAVLDERPAPKNPVGEIPSVLADAEGRQYGVFTPEEGGRFDGGDVTISADPGVVPNLEIVGLRADAAGPASNVGMTRQRYTLVGDRYDVLAVDAAETSISSYVLNSPLEVCVPLPPEARHDISDVAVVVNNPDGTLTVLSASVRITASSGVKVCGNLGTLPASIAVGTAGSPDAIPTPTPDPDAIADPDTGGYAPLGSGLVLVVMIVGGVIVLGGVLLARRRGNV